MEDYPTFFDLLNSSEVLEDTTGGLLTENPLLGVPTAVILCLLCLMTFFGNAVVLHAIRTERRLQTFTCALQGIIISFPKNCHVNFKTRWCNRPSFMHAELSQNPVQEIDEAHFWLNGYVNKQNCRISREANPQVYVETPLYPEKLTVWCALWASGILLQK
ncbi:uncharacterized protein TNCV_1487311 [Trichonephila clavipes]|nr:uncharacterized protein TNCV_1487311 [Trichonephila clavipes]